MKHLNRLWVPLLTVVMAGVFTLGADDAAAQATSDAKTHAMKIRIKLRDKTLTATLADNPTSADFFKLLPLKLTLKDYARKEKIADLPRRLTTKGAPSGSDPSVGDIAYYAPWGNLAIYYKDFGYSDGLIILGKLDSGVDLLPEFDAGEVTIERVDR